MLHGDDLTLAMRPRDQIAPVEGHVHLDILHERGQVVLDGVEELVETQTGSGRHHDGAGLAPQ